MKRRAVTADEHDAFYARKFYCYLQRAGVTDAIKRRARRRERREARTEIRRQMEDS